MFLVFLQFVLSLLAGAAIFLFWRRITKTGGLVFWLVTTGFLIRAIGGQMAFWISYLHLPVARSLQVGNGLWIFAVDSIGYFGRAAAAADAGFASILMMPRTEISVFYAQTLAASLLLFGAVTATAVFLNLFCYLGCCAMALKLAPRPDHPAAVLAIAAISLSPSAILWSAQPLKDTLFLFVVGAAFAVAKSWQQVWREGSGRVTARAIAATITLVAIVYAISAIRWYIGLLVVAAMIPFVVLTTYQSVRRLAPAMTSVALLALSFFAFFAGAGPYTPPPLWRAVFRGGIKQKAMIPEVLLQTVDEQRRAFDLSAGATMIGAGKAVQDIDSKLGVQSQRVAAVYQPGMVVAPEAGPALPSATTSVPVTKTPVTKTPVTRTAVPARPPTAAPVPQRESDGPDERTVLVPASRLSRLLTGFTAVLLPRFIAESSGLVDVGGGRGMWLFVELDTLVFDLFFVLAVAAVIGALRRRALGAPLFWLIFILVASIATLLAYTVSNFGTLFRHRDMVLLMLALLPLAVAEPLKEREAEEPSMPAWTASGATTGGV